MLEKEKEHIFIGDVSKTKKCQNICLIKAALFISRSKNDKKNAIFLTDLSEIMKIAPL